MPITSYNNIVDTNLGGQVIPHDHPYLTHLKYTSAGNSQQFGANYTACIYETKVYDVLNEYNNTNGRFTPLTSGYYLIAAGAMLGTGTWTAGQYAQLFIKKNDGTNTVTGIGHSGTRSYPAAASSIYVNSLVSTTMKLVVGDFIAITFYTSHATIALHTDPIHNWLTIDKVG